jgi:hypothetical protein
MTSSIFLATDLPYNDGRRVQGLFEGFSGTRMHRENYIYARHELLYHYFVEHIYSRCLLNLYAGLNNKTCLRLRYISY